jgi:MATH domain
MQPQPMPTETKQHVPTPRPGAPAARVARAAHSSQHNARARAGDSQALPGHISVYLQITDPAAATARWECFTSYRLCIEHASDPEKTIARDSWHRFSPKKKSHGWCDFTPGPPVLDLRGGFCVNDSIVVSADILLLKEECNFSREPDVSGATTGAEVLAGKFTWKVHNIPGFMEVMSMQKIMSPVFPAGDCLLRLSVYQSAVADTDYLSMCLETKDGEKGSNGGSGNGGSDRTCWCLFRMSVLAGRDTDGSHMVRDSFGRFAADAATGDTTSLGWNDFMLMHDFLNPAEGHVSADGTAVFCASFHIIRESATFTRGLERLSSSGGSGGGGGKRGRGAPSDAFSGRFVWRIEYFTKLKELLKKRKIGSLCIKSKRFQARFAAFEWHRLMAVAFIVGRCANSSNAQVAECPQRWSQTSSRRVQVGGKDCRLIVYPRGQSQPPQHLSLFLEVTDPRSADAEWSCFVSHRLSVVNQLKDSGDRGEKDLSVAKESQNRYSKVAKDWGWREFVPLTSLFDADLGFLVNDTLVLAAEVRSLEHCHHDFLFRLLCSDLFRCAPPLCCILPNSLCSSRECVELLKAACAWHAQHSHCLRGQQADSASLLQVLVLKESCELRIVPLAHDSSKAPPMPHAGGAGTAAANGTCTAADAPGATTTVAAIPPGKKLSFYWKIDNFLAFKEILETRKIFSKYITVGGCDLRIGVYESFDTLCIYLESESQSAAAAQVRL